MSNKPQRLTYNKAQENGTRATAIIHGAEFAGYTYQGYFFHYLRDIGATKVLIQHCEKIRPVRK